MAAIIAQPLSKTGKRFHSVKIDMTPMVDLGFQLITFFIFTTSLTQPAVAKLNMPAQTTNEPPMFVYEKTLLTAIIDKDRIYAYEGGLEKALSANGIRKTDYNVKTGLGNLVRQKQSTLDKEGLKDKLMVIIKPLPSASYQSLMNALDEMLINGVGRYTVVDASPKEKEIIAVMSH